MNEDLKALQASIDDIAKRIKSLDEKTVAPKPDPVTFESLASSPDFLKGISRARTFQTNQENLTPEQLADNSFEGLIRRSGL